MVLLAFRMRVMRLVVVTSVSSMAYHSYHNPRIGLPRGLFLSMAYSQSISSSSSSSSSSVTSPPPTQLQFVIRNTTIADNDTLAFDSDKYDGVLVNSKQLPDNIDEFDRLLKVSMDVWKDAKKRGVWLKIPEDKIDFVPRAMKRFGFKLHHSKPGYVMLTNWLSDPADNHMPGFANHQVGIGAIVYHKEKILLVKERSGPLRGVDFYKIPTGLVDEGEEIPHAAVREVLEETGVRTEFIGVVCFRHAHKILFGQSDLFFLCLLKPVDDDVNIVVQKSELDDCEFRTLEEYMGQSFLADSQTYQLMNKAIAESIADYKAGTLDRTVFNYNYLDIGWRPGKQAVYTLRPDDKTKST